VSHLLNLTGQTALVTGASGDIGAAIAVMLARHGADVAIHYAAARDRAEAVARGIEAEGRRALVLQADLTRSGDIAKLGEEALAGLGRIDILVNNAGVRRRPGDHKYVLDTTEEEWDREIDSHLKAAFLCAKAVLPSMIRHRFGRIVNVSSVVARSGAIGASLHYPAAKAGMFGMSKALANQVAGDGITVNVVAPGIIDTERVRWRTEEQMAAHVATIPIGRLGTVDEIAAAVLFLSSGVAGYITGATLDVNGGLYMA
jgi:3-oxoacyl-[acyl-carrier protein] reductase